jgi:ketosteroid isomerase-like protein
MNPRNGGVARDPQELARFLVSRGNAREVEGLVALYKPDAVVAWGEGRTAVGSGAIRSSYTRLLARGRTFDLGEQPAALICGDLALTSSRLSDGRVTVEVARKQRDGRWLWIIDQPSIVAG